MRWTRCERRRRRGGRGGACCGGHGADDQDGVDGAVLDGERVEQCADGAAASRKTAPSSQEQLSQAQAPPPGPCGRARRRAGGRILVTVVSTSRLPVVTEMSRARWPSSPTSRSCGCLHRGSNAQAVSKTGEAARSTRADGQRKWRRASRRARSLRSRAGAGADIARARPRARAPAACAAALRAQRQGRPKLRRMRGGRPGWGAHLWWVGVFGL
jgi:hypothetical protein